MRKLFSKWLCETFGHKMYSDTTDIAGPSSCGRYGCKHKEPGIEWDIKCPTTKFVVKDEHLDREAELHVFLYKCPKCEIVCLFYEFRYCSNCGIKLVWEATIR